VFALLTAVVAPVASAAPGGGGELEGVVLTTTLSPAFVPPKAAARLSVHAPALAGQVISFQQLTTRSGWVDLKRVMISPNGDAAITVRPMEEGGAQPLQNGTVSYRAQFAPASGAARRLVVTSYGFGDPTAYTFLRQNRYGPARWDPCRVITYRSNLAAAPPGAAADLAEAVRRVAQATGLRFRSLGSTDQIPGSPSYRQHADIDVAWAEPRQTDYLDRDGSGAEHGGDGGARVRVTGSGRLFIDAGYVLINAETARSVPAGFGSGVTQGSLLLHEFGHVVGLHHADSADQIMRPAIQPDLRAALYGAGDLAGLRQLGSAKGCNEHQ
jgi:hypothetical protein